MAKLEEEIMKTILGMKRVITGDQDSSDPEEPYLQPSNRGNKLKRKANHMQDGQYGRTWGPKIFKATIEHAGYRRNILQLNPKRYDRDGIELSDSDEDEEADAQAADENPYAEIRLENLLLPLVSAASLPEHPSLSVAYTSSMLTDMAQHSYEMIQRERKGLNSAKQLLTKFRGDKTWIPCGLLCSEDDEKIFDTTKLFPDSASGHTPQGSSVYTAQGTINGGLSSDRSLERRDANKPECELGPANGISNGSSHDSHAIPSSEANHASTNGASQLHASVGEASVETNHIGTGKEDVVEMANSKIQDSADEESTSNNLREAGKNIEDEIFGIVGPDVLIVDQEESEDVLNEGRAFLPPETVHEANGIEHQREKPVHRSGTEPADIANAGDLPDAKEEENNIEEDGRPRPPPRRMRTRAQAQAASEPAASSRTETPDAWVPPEIHPLFLIPARAIPDTDFGLPPNEAEETRRLLMAYVQKQEEVVRGAEKLYESLMQAERQRNAVFKWCKAEGHVGEMSDGEDWYDKDEWGLEDDLRKGHNDEEEDTAVAGKKTRGRRA